MPLYADPSKMAMLGQLLGGTGQGAPAQAQAAPPVAPPAQATPQGEPNSQVAEQMGLTRADIATQLQRARGAGNQAMGAIQGEQQLKVPEMGYNPQMKSVTGQGFGHDTGNLLGDISKAILLTLSATRPGQAIQGAVYGPKVREYEAQKGALATQVQQLQTQQEREEQPLSPLQAMAYHYGQVDVNQQNANTRKQMADTRATAVAQQHADRLANLSLGWGKLSETQKKDQATAEYHNALESIARERIAAGMSENDARIQAQEDIVTAIQTDKRLDSPIKTQLLQWLGAEPTVAAPAGANAPGTVGVPPTPSTPSKGTAGAGAKTHTPGGQAHGLKEGQTGTGDDGNKYVVRGGKWVLASPPPK